MASITMSNIAGREVAQNLRNTSQSLSESLKRLSSGLRIQKPQDGAVDYMRASSLEGQVRTYEDIRRNMGEYESVLTLANDAASEIRSSLESMLEKATQASDPAMGAAERGALFTEYNALRTGIDNMVKGTKYDNGSILTAAGKYNQPLTVNLTPDRSVSMSIDMNPLDVTAAAGAGLVIDNTAWADATASGASATEIGTALDTLDSFTAEVSGNLNELERHVRLTDSTIENTKAARSTIIEVDLADEMTNYTTLDVTKEAAISMLAQANMSHRSVLKLYEFAA